MHVRFSDNTETAIVSVFGGPQDPAVYTHLGEVADDDPRLLALINPGSTLAGAYASALYRINAACDAAAAQIKIGYAESEVDTWTTQEREARAWVADNTSPVPMVSAIATRRGMAIADLVGRIITKADLYPAMIGAVVGDRQAYEDQINAVMARTALPSTDPDHLTQSAAIDALRVL